MADTRTKPLVAPCGCHYTLIREAGTRGGSALCVKLERYERCDVHNKITDLYLAEIDVARYIGEGNPMHDWPARWAHDWDTYYLERKCPHGAWHPDAHWLYHYRICHGPGVVANLLAKYRCDGCCKT